ncbi:Periplasmic dipeptide transport protein [Candidatus Glomeribacter gigasporarum BEG34]|uniref:Periplasmic dipeptide transport protein n=1 Tax=Candidatus Glomeribacter gigasporarum BEG34 TaxID=1070319 RepID=G2JA39_9BURK|nr:ABC transporter substrate-binding protein [Candidatus Glomeribacter gigasporarum]CCD29638.1 Periplasmic dipeptide transport protein [Candidatus Glomeribacter gigasporarum BEG34]
MTTGVLNAVCAALPNKQLVYCSEASPMGFDPSQLFNGVDYAAAGRTLYDTLIRFDRNTLALKPSLATDWRVSEDGRVYTFHLRHGVKFHNTPWFKPTRDFNAEDVVFTFERMRNPNMSFRRAYPTESPFWTISGFNKTVEKIEALDPYTVRFTLNTAYAPFLPYLTAPSASILSAEYSAQLLKAGKPSDINQYPVGTGPFIFRKYIPDATIEFNGNPNYWNPADVKLAKLIFSITPDAKVQVQKLKTNECHVISAAPLEDIPALERNPDFNYLAAPEFSIGYLAYNVTHKPLNDVRVRRVLDRVIDKKAIIDIVFKGRAQVAVSPMPPLQWGYDHMLKDMPRNFERARMLLAQAGYPNGFSMALWTLPMPRTYNPNPRLMAEIIQSDWKKIGVKAKIVTYEFGEYLKRGMKGEHDTMLIGVGGIRCGDPVNFFNPWMCDALSGTNFSKWCFKPFERLLGQAARTLDRGERTALYLRAQKIFKRQQPATPIAYPFFYHIVNKKVTGFRVDPFGTVSFAGVGLR